MLHIEISPCIKCALPYFERYQKTTPPTIVLCCHHKFLVTIQPYLKPDVDGENPFICIYGDTFV
ncbi:MAG: hypothetical protein ACT6FB_05085, partial [Methanosarcinaceae archaeon]